ncbi:MAG: translation elongation factor Ts [Gemmatimonadetes bacterium]|nr:translation elongation factor Ts [Gemmatimonadota bacterium]NIR79582.1 translation elongation factor Ts [Gemmatimonadota bacterium]NIT88273.1 translation elongation factor Ts [Gemmatimonadota bacterium]NIU32071.1 translation elongation factor Ts [Gemmatimonadota bacterium]NIU36671.1 translation elongation factor Ts [Gemmatimonadota bacterium]
MAISAQEVKQLRDRTGAGMMDCKKALEETEGDMEAAIDVLRSRGAAKAAKRADKAANEGRVGHYVHFGGKIGVLVELNCETDFVANTDEFQDLARDLAMHVAASGPIAVAVDDVPDETVDRERKVFLEQAREEGKPEHIREKIVEGKLRKFFEENVLLEQAFVKDTDRTIQDLIDEATVQMGEKIEIARFVRYEVGEGA